MNYVSRRGRGRGGRGKNKRGGSRAARIEEPICPDLIEPNKVFVANITHSISNEYLKRHLSKFVGIVSVNIIRKPGSQFPYHFGFVQLANEADTQKLLNLEKSNCTIHGGCLEFKPAKRQFKVPGNPSYRRIPLSDRDFDLNPPDPQKACIHALIDDVLLQIFEHLPLKNLVRIEKVCRRWQGLVYTSFRRKVFHEIKGDKDTREDLIVWMVNNKVMPTFPSISKVLILCGETITHLSLGEASFPMVGKMFRVLSQLCPSLESLSLHTVVDVRNHFLTEFVNTCTNIKEFCIKERSPFNDGNLTCLLTGYPNLEVLHLKECDIQGSSFEILSPSLKVLVLSRCTFLNQKSLSHIPKRCSRLEVLRLEGASMPTSLLHEISVKCPLLNEMSIEIVGPAGGVDMSTFKNLKKLKFFSCTYSVNNLLKSLPQLEELRLDGSISETANDVIDFSSMTNLRVLTLPWNNRVSANAATLKTISLCSKLEKFKFRGTDVHKMPILQVIRRCTQLRELDSPTITLGEQDIASFVDANKDRAHRLKIVIGLDRSALEHIQVLNDANYEVEMFDVHNLFSDFDVFDEFEDALEDFYFDSDGSLDSDDANFFLFDDELEDYHRFFEPLGFLVQNDYDLDYY